MLGAGLAEGVMGLVVLEREEEKGQWVVLRPEEDGDGEGCLLGA